MNIILLSDNDQLDNGYYQISGEAYTHCQKVLKVSIGDTLQVGLLNHLLGSAKVLSICTENERIIVDPEFKNTPPPALNLTIILALPRPKVLKRLLQNLAELGVKKIILINAYKVEKSYWQSPVIDKANDFFKLGLEQAKDCVLPEIHLEKLFKPFVEDRLPALIAESTQAFVAHPYSTSNTQANNQSDSINLKDIQPTSAPASSTLQASDIVVIGPEGGFIPYEIEKLIAAGCKTCSLGQRIYRVEHAVNLLCHQYHKC